MPITPIRKILFLLVFLYAGSLVAQENSVDSKAFNILGLSDFFISAKTAGNTYVFTMYTIADGPTKAGNITFTLRPLTKESFIQNFFTSLNKFQNKIPADQKALLLPSAQGMSYDITKPDTTKTAEYRILETEASRLFYMFVAESIVFDDLGNEPIAGTICYVDSILIRRKDVDKSLQSRINRLWKLYRQDQKRVKYLLKTGELDQYLNLGREIPDSVLMNLSKRTGKDSISGEFKFSEIMEQLNKREFTKGKEANFIQRRAADRQRLYENTLDTLNEVSSRLKAAKDSLNTYSRISKKLEEVKGIENQKRAIFKKLEDDFNKIRNQVYEIHFIDRDIELIDSISYNELQIIEALDQKQAEFMACLYNEGSAEHYITYDKEKCFYYISALNTELDKAATILMQALTTDSSVQDTLDAEVAIKRMKRVQVIMNDSLYATLGRYHKYAVEIAKLHEQQLQIANQLGLEDYRLLLLSNLDKIKDYPVISEGVRTVSYPKWLPVISLGLDDQTIYLEEKIKLLAKSNQMIHELDSLRRDIDTNIVVKLSKSINELEIEEKDKIGEIAQQEDLLIFKGFKVDSIVIEINEGFIENILMVGKINEYTDKYGHVNMDDGKAVLIPRTLKFENSSPIGFSRKLDFDDLKNVKLYTRGGARTQYETDIEDILSIYVQQHEVGRRDYSPANQKVVLKNNTIGKVDLCKDLTKEATYQLFEAKIFSDFVGLDETEPNGLIQTEINKRINLRTSRCPIQFCGESNMGFLSFLEPSLTLSKIENNNKFLTLENKDRFINNQYTPIKFTSTLSLKQFENFSAGATTNLLLLDIPNLKSTLFLNWGFRYGRTGIQDSIRTVSNGMVIINEDAVDDYGVNTFAHAPELMWNIYADERYGFSMSWQHHWFHLRDNRFEQVSNTTFFENQVVNSTKQSRQFNTFRFLTTLEQTSNNKGRLFFRYTYNWQQGFWRTGFHQAQVGYSFFLLGRVPEND